MTGVKLPRVSERQEPRGRSKFGAVRTEVDGVTFASKAEARRYGELKLLLKAGHISQLALHPRFPLEAWTEGRTRGGEVIGQYVADFSYLTHSPGEPARFVVEDVKGMKTLPLAKWKQKHLLAQYGFTVVEIRRRG